MSWKKATRRPAVGYDASVEEALCFGLDRAAALELPEDLAEALGRAAATAGWEAYPPFVRRGSLAWIDGAKRPETRARRVAEVAAAAAAAAWLRTRLARD